MTVRKINMALAYKDETSKNAVLTSVKKPAVLENETLKNYHLGIDGIRNLLAALRNCCSAKAARHDKRARTAQTCRAVPARYARRLFGKKCSGKTGVGEQPQLAEP